MNADVVVDRQDLPEGPAREGSSVHDELGSSACADLFLKETEVAGLRQLHSQRIAHRESGQRRDDAPAGQRRIPARELPEVLGIVDDGKRVPPSTSRGHLKGVVELSQVVTRNDEALIVSELDPSEQESLPQALRVPADAAHAGVDHGGVQDETVEVLVLVHREHPAALARVSGRFGEERESADGVPLLEELEKLRRRGVHLGAGQHGPTVLR